MSIEQIIRRGEYYFQVTLDGGGAVCLPETSGEDERRAEERDTTNEGETRNEKKKNSPLVPGISVAYRWHENVAFGFFQVTSKRKVLSSPAHPLLGRSGRSLVGLWLIEANDFFSLSASLFFF